MVSSGLRQATDHETGPRIITPSSTAWPPMEGRGAVLACGLRRGRGALRALVIRLGTRRGLSVVSSAIRVKVPGHRLTIELAGIA